MALLLVACSGGSSTTTPPGASAAALLDGSARAMTAVSSFVFSLENKGGDTPLPAGLAMRGAEGAMAKPDRFSATIKAVFSGFLTEVKVVSTGGVTYLSNPLGGGWQKFESGVSPVAFFDPANGVSLILSSMTDARLAGEGALDGVAVQRVAGRVPAAAVQFIAGSFAEGSVLDAALAIGKQDLLLRQVTLKGRITASEPEGIVRVLTFGDFNRSFTIEPPV